MPNNFVETSKNTHGTWDCGKPAIGLFFLHIMLEELLGIRGVLIFFCLKKRKNHLNNHIFELLGSKLTGIRIRHMCIGLPRDCY